MPWRRAGRLLMCAALLCGSGARAATPLGDDMAPVSAAQAGATDAEADAAANSHTYAGAANGHTDVGGGLDAADAADPRQMLVMLHLPPPHFRPQAGYAGAYNDNAGHAARRRVAEELATRYGLTLLADWPMPVLGVDCYVMQAPAGVPPASVVPDLARDARVAWAQPMLNYSALGLAAGDGGSAREGVRDPLYATQPGAKFWHIAELHRRATGRKVSVAVIDSGIDAAHPDLAGQIALSENFVDASAERAESHGTAVAGIIAAKAGNGVGIEGVAPDARLMALRACWELVDLSTRCNSFTLAKALNFALLHDARVINMSLGGPPDLLLRRLVEVALERGVAVVAALDPRSADGGFPAAYPGVIAVGLTAGQVAGLDSVSAPGADIPSTLPGARWGLVNGTSFAAAHVAGLAALMTELRPGTPLRREAFLDGAALAAGAAQTVPLDACATLARVAGDCVCACGALLAAKGGQLR